MRRGIAAALLVLAVLAAGCGDDDVDRAGRDRAGGPSTSAQEVASSEGESDGGWLFVVEAEGGTSDGTTLSLTGVDEDVVAFGDRPARRAERLPTAALVDDWSTLGFDEDPPNAAVTVETEAGAQTGVVVLRDPAFDASSGTLTFATEPVADEGGELLGFGGPPVEALPATFGPATVFVDAGASSGQPAQGEIAVFGITEDDYALQKEAAQKASRNACVTIDQLEVCGVLQSEGSGVSWTVAAALVEGDDAAQSSFELTVVYPGQVYAEVSSLDNDTDSRWVEANWESPSIGIPGAGLEVEAVVQIGDSDAVTVSCVVPSNMLPLNYYCFDGTN